MEIQKKFQRSTVCHYVGGNICGNIFSYTRNIFIYRSSQRGFSGRELSHKMKDDVHNNWSLKSLHNFWEIITHSQLHHCVINREEYHNVRLKWRLQFILSVMNRDHTSSLQSDLQYSINSFEEICLWLMKSVCFFSEQPEIVRELQQSPERSCFDGCRMFHTLKIFEFAHSIKKS